MLVLTIYPPRGTIMQASELRDFYKPHRPSHVARAQRNRLRAIRTLLDRRARGHTTRLPYVGQIAHFIVGGLAPSSANSPNSSTPLTTASTDGASTAVW
jgi:hypothetical protein